MKKAKPSNFLLLLVRAVFALLSVVIIGALFYHFLIPALEENDESLAWKIPAEMVE
jgi:hypothetical protein